MAILNKKYRNNLFNIFIFIFWIYYLLFLILLKIIKTFLKKNFYSIIKFIDLKVLKKNLNNILYIFYFLFII